MKPITIMRGVAPLAGSALGAALLAAGPAAAQDRALAFTDAKILTMAGETIENGALVIEDGVIVAVGSDVAIPADAERRSLRGRVVMPGIVDTHSHIGQVAGADGSGPIQPEVRALDSIDALSSNIAKARAGGVTTANVMPGSGHLMSGQTYYMKLRDGKTAEDIAFSYEDGEALGGMKMANGTNSMRGAGGFPGTRAKSAALVRESFVEAQAYCDGDRKKRDLAKEALCEVLSGERLVHFHTHRADDIMTVLRLKREFDFDVLIQHGTETYKVADKLAEAGIPVSNITLDAPGGKLETMDLRLDNAGILERAGVLVSIHSDDPIVDSRMMLREAAMAVRGGMSREGALRALTINGAKQMRLDDRVGSLEAGKDADFLILDGDPFSVYTHILETWVEGEKLFDRSREEDLKMATGGYGAGSPLEASHHHWEIAAGEGGQ
ncbi:amidohydrolase family protein [Erythrobacter sp. HL-111]|uniref:amidohydrolase family protein n=1 Tax=Erythrobacter sp. HL-111 TaxID=1798193 RepID=UPI0006D99E32|nr:amidohydrolase family protein [Erythrobacter sp. HL-111]KPP92609.1 MAG: putative amidohydrolase [Erythrobacteraceae bacterium HL-111]SDS94303.1 Imidazolonepropionase [Erythrobacter sp. HL-111]